MSLGCAHVAGVVAEHLLKLLGGQPATAVATLEGGQTATSPSDGQPAHGITGSR
jgi:hypothetical protein